VTASSLDLPKALWIELPFNLSLSDKKSVLFESSSAEIEKIKHW
jgi:hypothetical protein